MDRQERIDLILDHYEHPRYAGRLDPADVIETGHNPGCGDEITVYLRVNGDDHTASLSFEGKGCTISQAAASMVMEMLQGQPLDRVAAAPANALEPLLGEEITATRPRCSALALETVKAAGQAFQQHHQSLIV